MVASCGDCLDGGQGIRTKRMNSGPSHFIRAKSFDPTYKYNSYLLDGFHNKVELIVLNIVIQDQASIFRRNDIPTNSRRSQLHSPVLLCSVKIKVKKTYSHKFYSKKV